MLKVSRILKARQAWDYEYHGNDILLFGPQGQKKVLTGAIAQTFDQRMNLVQEQPNYMEAEEALIRGYFMDH